jgi:RimJ/RimL family protein N-acetyltransferase
MSQADVSQSAGRVSQSTTPKNSLGEFPNEELLIREVAPEDIWDVLAWRNDPLTRAMSLSTTEISPAEHQVWFSREVLKQPPATYIGLFRTSKLGICRFHETGATNTWSVSINLNPAMRGQRLAQPFLTACIKFFRRTSNATLTATIKGNNEASIRLFISCGFQFTSTAEGVATYALE